MPSKYAIHIESINNLQIRVLVIGGVLQGESIIIIMSNKESREVHRVVLIDSFRGIHDLLNNYQENWGWHHLSAVCWTHPHDDHTLDLEEILEDEKLAHLGHSQNDTLFVFPQILNQFTQEHHVYRDYGHIICKKPQRPIGISDNPYNKINIFWDFIDDTDDTLHQVCLHFISPFHNLGDKNLNIAEYDNRSKYNEMSLSCILMIDGIPYIYFGGDSPDSQIEGITPGDKSLINMCEIVKVPHHGSSGSLKVLDYISNKLRLAIITVFRKDDTVNLPDDVTLERYNEKLLVNDGILYVTDQPIIKEECKFGVAELLLEHDRVSRFVMTSHELYGINQQYERI